MHENGSGQKDGMIDSRADLDAGQRSAEANRVRVTARIGMTSRLDVSA